jgi:predicted dehydrogenase
MTDPIRIGVIGTGQIGKHHLKTYFDKVPGVQVVAVADLNEAEARRVADLHGIPAVYTDFRELLKRDDIVAVDVCLHNNFHAPVAMAVMQAGKHVYCEKPLAGSYYDAEQMVKTAQETGRMLHMQLSTLYSKEVRAAKYLIDAGKLGKLYHARSVGHRRRGRPFVDGYGTPSFVQKEVSAGGALYDMGVYHIASTLYLLGNPEVLTICGQTYQETPVDPDRQAQSGYNVEELGLGFVRLGSNITMDIFESWAYHMDVPEGTTVAGSEGGVKLEPFGYYFNVGDLSLDAKANLDSFTWRRNALRANADAEEGSQQHWAAVLQGRVPLLPTAELGLKTMLISEGIYLSTQLGREVTAEEVRAESKSTAIKL